LINAEWVFEIERECFILEREADVELTIVLLCKLEDPIFKICTVSVFFALWYDGLTEFETHFVDVFFSPLETLAVEPQETRIVMHGCRDAL
jgi:hypothetical protein